MGEVQRSVSLRVFGVLLSIDVVTTAYTNSSIAWNVQSWEKAKGVGGKQEEERQPREDKRNEGIAASQ